MKTAATTARRRFVSSAAGSAALLTVRRPTRAAQYEFKCGSILAADHPSSIRLRQMWTEVEQQSGGRIRVQFFPNSALGGDSAQFSQLRVGALEFYLLNPGILASVVPSADITSVGFVYKDAGEAHRVIDGPVGNYIRSEAASKGLHVLTTGWDSGMAEIGCASRPIRVPDDLHGFKVRVVASKVMVDLFKELGATPVPLAAGEIYTALQTKLIDGTVSTPVAMETYHLYEVMKYLSMVNFQWSGIWLVANGDVWKSLAPDLQGLLERANAKYAKLDRVDSANAADEVGTKLATQGIVINEVDQTPFRARLHSYFAASADQFGTQVWSMLQTSIGRKLN